VGVGRTGRSYSDTDPPARTAKIRFVCALEKLFHGVAHMTQRPLYRCAGSAAGTWGTHRAGAGRGEEGEEHS
jgi:hypothetical protein